MRRRIGMAYLALAVVGTGTARAQSGDFFKNLFGGGIRTPDLLSPKAMDPNEARCPAIVVAGGGAAVQTFAGPAGDATRLRHQIALGRLGRECAMRPDGAVAVKVGVEVRALLGPAGVPGTFEAPLTVSVVADDKPVLSRLRRVAVPVPAGTAQGTASVIEDGLIVPAEWATGYDIVVSLAGQAGRAKPASVAAKRFKPAATGTSATGTSANKTSATQPSSQTAAVDAAAAGSRAVGQSLFDQDIESPR